MARRFWSLAVIAAGFTAACGGNTEEVGTTSSGGSSGQPADGGGSAGGSGRGGSSGTAGGAGRGGSGGVAGSAGSGAVAGRGGSAGSGFDAAGGSGGDPDRCRRMREQYEIVIERSTSCNLSLSRAPCTLAAPGQCCPHSVDLPGQAEELALVVAQLNAACGPPACPELVCPSAPSQHCEPDAPGSALGHCR
jgi:hypothetical protein